MEPKFYIGMVTDVVYSPDDGGWYAHQWEFLEDGSSRYRVSRKAYASRRKLDDALNNSKVTWEAWK